VKRDKRLVRWLGWTASSLAIALALAFAAQVYAARWEPPTGENYVALLDLASAYDAGGVPAVEEKLPDLTALPRWVAVLAADTSGLVLASSPPGAVGRQLPTRGSPFDEVLKPQPDVDLWDRGRPTSLAGALGVTGGVGDYFVFGSSTPGPAGGGAEAFFFAVVAYPKFLGLSSHDWAGPLEDAALALFALATLALAAWVYADARRREVDAPVAWAVLTLVTNAIGWATYLVARGWRRAACPACGAALRPSYRACPHCGVQVQRGCPSCGQAVREDWSFCPHCTAALT